MTTVKSKKIYKMGIRAQERINQIITLTKKTSSNFFDNFSVIGSWQKTNESRHKQKTNDSIVSNRYEKVFVYDAILDFKKDIKALNLNYGASYRKQYVNSRANLENENGQEFLIQPDIQMQEVKLTMAHCIFKQKLNL